jgi:predicted metal-dependent phosphoesterase TrpH
LHIDLHTHSTYSDGVLPPETLVWRAARRGVKVLALTDHDETGGLGEAARASAAAGIRFVPGIEISASWRSQTIHVIGLGIYPGAPALNEGLAFLRSARETRAEKIAERLRLAGVTDALRGARVHAGSGVSVGRSHFARFLVDRGHSRDFGEASGSTLSQNVPCAAWPAMTEAQANPFGRRHRSARTLSATVFRSSDASLPKRSSRPGAPSRSEPATTYVCQQMRTARRFGFELSTAHFHAPGEGARDGGYGGSGESALRVAPPRRQQVLS